MNIYILYFASVKEKLNISHEEIAIPAEVNTIKKLKVFLATRGEVWAGLFEGNQLIRAAVNQTLIADDGMIQNGDEVAFFPPVTGG